MLRDLTFPVHHVFVEVPSLSSEDNTITLRGPQEKLGVALTQVYEKVNNFYLSAVYVWNFISFVIWLLL